MTRYPGLPHTSVFHPGHSGPGPRPSLQPSACSLAWVGEGPGNPAGGALRRGRRRRCESRAATPPSPWRRRGGERRRTQPGDQSWVIQEAGAPSTVALL